MPATTATDFATRTCSICERDLPATDEHFYTPPGRDQESWCRECGRPRNGRGRKFGVEIEFIGNQEAVVRAMRARGLTVSYEGYSHRVTRGAWKIVTDASVSNGYELVSPPLRGQGGLGQVKKACYALQDAGARIDRQCGLHVHHDIADLNSRQIGRLARVWSANQQGTNELVAPSRRNCNWALPLTAEEVARLEQVTGSTFTERQDAVRGLSYRLDRYRSLNFAAFPRYGTVEIRQHQGSMNAEKIVAWILFGKAMISWAKSNDNTAARGTGAYALVDHLAAHHGLPAATARFLKERAEFFGARRPAAAVA